MRIHVRQLELIKFADKVRLTCFNRQGRLLLIVNGCTIAVHSVLQCYYKKSEPFAFFLNQLSQAEPEHRVRDRQLLGVYSNIKHFRHILEDRGSLWSLQTTNR